MIKSNRIKVDGVNLFIVPSGFTFVRQTCVKFYGKRLSKVELIKCCQHYIGELQILCYSDRLNCGFNLKSFNYYELSVYLHGLISLYCAHLDYDCPPYFDVISSSRLPHDVIKPEPSSEFHVSSVRNIKNGKTIGYSYYFNNDVTFYSSLSVLKSKISEIFHNKSITFIIH